MVSPYSSSLWTVGSSSLWDTTWVHRFVMLNFLGEKVYYFRKILPWSLKPGPFHSTAHGYWKRLMLWNRKGLACESEPWHPRCSICDQVAHYPTLSFCLCASQNVSSFGSSLSVKLSHLLSGELQCVRLYHLYVVGSLCLCKNKMSNLWTTACKDVPHFLVRWHFLCVWL